MILMKGFFISQNYKIFGLIMLCLSNIGIEHCISYWGFGHVVSNETFFSFSYVRIFLFIFCFHILSSLLQICLHSFASFLPTWYFLTNKHIHYFFLLFIKISSSSWCLGDDNIGHGKFMVIREVTCIKEDSISDDSSTILVFMKAFLGKTSLEKKCCSYTLLWVDDRVFLLL